MDKKVISADGHLDLFFLPPDTFTARTTDRLKDKVPKVVNIDGIPSWCSARGRSLDQLGAARGLQPQVLEFIHRR